MRTMASAITGVSFTQRFVQAKIKENIKDPRRWPFLGESTSDQWIPRTKGQ